MADKRTISTTVNGVVYERAVEPRITLADFLRHELELTGTHLGCEHGVCGACTVLVDGRSVRGCLMLAVQVNGRKVETVEGSPRPTARSRRCRRRSRNITGCNAGSARPEC